ncbi:MAG TPA: NAD(P)/FAD-dependent oxidoreductase [Streptosporangiaceae bacterium]|jgi:cation diffusion facilitator CzcD-associated flavoprotein CzcO
MTEHVDVLIVGAGLSGIGAAHQLQRAFPQRKYTILEARDAIGGTWDLFRYPGVRSDSDMQTLGYRWRPWTGAKAIADGPSILQYVRDTATEAGIDRHIRFGLRVTRASWSSADARWTVEASQVASQDGGQPASEATSRADGADVASGASSAGEPGGAGAAATGGTLGTVTFTCNFLLVCTGYYRYDHGYQADLPGIENFGGRVVHPQQWPQDLDYAGQRVAVVGSGATAVTIVPAMAETAAHVTMVQRSPSYIISVPTTDPIDAKLRKRVGARRAYPVTRWKNVAVSTLIYQLSQRRPQMMRNWIRGMTVKQLPAGYDVDTHFKPVYGPWDQRLCLIPDGDLFRAIGEKKASVVTGKIATFTEHGIRMESGAEVEADIVVTATGLQLLALGGLQLTVDGQDISLPETMAYKATMLSGVPNFALTIGYTNASWTLKADLVSDFVVRLLQYMDRHNYAVCVPVNDDPGVTERPLLDFAAGYILRSMHEFPKSGSRTPWRLGMSYLNDVVMLRHGRIDDGVLRFSRRGAKVAREAEELVR